MTGESFKLILPNVDTDCMNIFLKELAEHLDNKKIILIIDGAGWHKSKNLRVPNNIILMFLPPYSPELNPIERLWLYIKKHVLNNKVYNNIEELKNSLCDFITNIDIATIANICKTSYLFNIN